MNIDVLILCALGANALATVGVLVMSWKNATKIEIVHKATNSMREQLVSVTASDSFQKGETTGAARERDRAASNSR
jgi:hypothetical protein